VNSNLEVNSGCGLNMEAYFGGNFQYGGEFRSEVNKIWRRVSEAILLTSVN
jgi:hypothetical protein